MGWEHAFLYYDGCYVLASRQIHLYHQMLIFFVFRFVFIFFFKIHFSIIDIISKTKILSQL